MVKNKYADDYEIVITKDNKKKTVYIGDYFEVSLDKDDTIKFKRQSILLLAAVATLHICGGFLTNQGMYQFYVSFPFVIAFFPLLYMAESILRLPKEKRKLRRDEIELSFNRLKSTSKILLFIIGLSILGEIVFLLFFMNDGQGGVEFLFLLVESLVIVSVYFIIRSHSQIQVQICEEEN